MHLTDYVWVFRYPGDVDPPSVSSAEDALALARTLYEAVLERMPEKAYP